MHRSMIIAGVVATSALILTAGAPAWAARPFVDHWTDHIEHIEQVEHGDDWCPADVVPFDVLYVEDAWGTFRFQQRGDGQYYGGSTFTSHGSWTNVENGKTFSFSRNGLDKDRKVTDNGDGTITIEGLSTGPTTYYGPDGERKFLDTGRNFYAIVIDTMGTPSNPDDDEFVEFLGADFKGHPETEGRDFCADIAEFLG
ncbi:hypothetical protein [Agromyces sp. M3QZ16-3]|uniref:hypothetical protein n=1 Tax=Agromyces sp. M3QZ16-3 TaxID=3447585 RepID=UPI003F691F4A